MRWWRERRSELDEREEVLAHIRIEADRLVAEGFDDAEAMRRARARFGGHRQLAPAELASGGSALADGLRNLRYTVRQLVGAPMTTATILISLIIGIGANTAIFSIADQALVRPMQIEDPSRVVQLAWEGRWIGEGRGWGDLLPHPLYAALAAERPASFTNLAARSPGAATVTSPAGSERSQIALVTGSFFETMGVRPHLGRLIDPSDDRILGAHPVAVLSFDYWRTRFGADPEVVGRQVGVNGEPMTVIGVAPDGFHGTDWSNVPSLWTSIMMNDLIHPWGRLDEPRIQFQHVFARLAPGVSRAEAETTLQPWFSRYIRLDMERPDWPAGLSETDRSAYLASRLEVIPGGRGQASRAEELSEPVLILTGATALLLFLACLNVANLSLARAVTRHRDAAVRVALGASRRRVVSERLLEAGLLATLGAGAGVLISPLIGRWILGYLQAGASDMALTAAVDGRTLGLAALIATAVTIVAGAGPAWFASGTLPMGSLRTREVGGGVRLRRVLVVGQIGLALVLLMGAGLFATTLRTLRGGGPGFETEQLVTFTVNPGADGYSAVEAKRLNREVLDATRTIAGVERAEIAAWGLLGGGGWGNSMLIEGRGPEPTGENLPMNAVTPGFFDLLGVDILEGRDFDELDRTEGEAWSWDVAIVSRSFVDRYLEGRQPIGVHIDFSRNPTDSPRIEIVGVVEDYAEQDLREPLPQVYFPYWAQVRERAVVFLRTRRTVATLGPEIREVVASVEPTLIVEDVRTLDEQVDRLLVVERMLASLGTAFALFGAVLAMIGIYGVLSYAVQARSKEMGIRMALGASASSTSGLLIRDAIRLAALGVFLGLPALWLLRPIIDARLVGGSTLDPRGLVVAAAAIFAIALAASALPALRMKRLDPIQVFRVE